MGQGLFWGGFEGENRPEGSNKPYSIDRLTGESSVARPMEALRERTALGISVTNEPDRSNRIDQTSLLAVFA